MFRFHTIPQFFSLMTLLVVLPVAACGDPDGPVHAGGRVEAVAEMLDEKGQKLGTAEFRQVGKVVTIRMQVSGLPPGVHALHIHEKAECHAADGEAFGAAGGHFNPTNKKHGFDNPEGPHAGDLPNFTVAADGTATVEVENVHVTLEEGPAHSLFHPGGTCLVIHAGPDDNKTDPAGNAGARLACGVIRRR